jgi:hypothetical protein
MEIPLYVEKAQAWLPRCETLDIARWEHRGRLLLPVFTEALASRKGQRGDLMLGETG